MSSVGEKILKGWELMRTMTLSVAINRAEKGRVWDIFYDARIEVSHLIAELATYKFKENENNWQDEYLYLTQWEPEVYRPYKREEINTRLTWIDATIEDLEIMLKEENNDE